jgi:hypothetical protein
LLHAADTETQKPASIVLLADGATRLFQKVKRDGQDKWPSGTAPALWHWRRLGMHFPAVAQRYTSVRDSSFRFLHLNSCFRRSTSKGMCA